MGSKTAVKKVQTDEADRAARLRHDRRQQILSSAKKVIAAHGYHKASINDIIKNAQIARGTFYLYFQSKKAVFDNIIQEAIRQLTSKIKPIRMDQDAPLPRVQLHSNLTRVFSYLYKDRALTQILLNQGLTPDAESSERVDAFYSKVIALMESSLKHGIAMGLVRTCDTRFVAAALLGAIRGAVIQMLEAKNQLAIDTMVDELIKFGLHGVRMPDLWGKDNS